MTPFTIKSWKENGQIKIEFGGFNFSRAECTIAFMGIEDELKSDSKYSGLNSNYSGDLIIRAFLPDSDPWETTVQIQCNGYDLDEIKRVVSASYNSLVNHYNSLNTIGNPKPSKELHDIACSFHFTLSMLCRNCKADLDDGELQAVLKNISGNNFRQIEQSNLSSDVYRLKLGLLYSDWRFSLYQFRTEEYNQWLDLAFFKNLNEKSTKLALMISDPQVVSAIKNEVFPSSQNPAPCFIYLTENIFIDDIGKNKCSLLENIIGNDSIFLFSNEE
jgi:hypothetical protein